MLTAFVTIALLPGCAAAQDPSCPNVDGLDPLLEPGTVLLLGEVHGTRESPAFAAATTCRALALGRDVVLAVEIEIDERPRIDDYLESAGTTEDRDSLLAGPFWHRAMQDGRSSRAMADLLERARELRGSTRGDLEVRPFDPTREGDFQERVRRMAGTLGEIVANAPDAVVIVLTGNTHARTTVGTRWDSDFEPMGYLLDRELPDRRIVSLNVEHAAGQAYACTGNEPEDCGRIDLNGSGSPEDEHSVRLREETGAPYDGVYTVGTVTASPPAVEDER